MDGRKNIVKQYLNEAQNAHENTFDETHRELIF